MNLKQYLTIQSMEIEGHRNFMELFENREINWEESFRDWVESPHHESAHFQELYLKRKSQLDQTCDATCGSYENCKGIGNCPMDREVFHRLIYGVKK